MQWRLTVFAALGGFLFGYDTSVINGALFQMKDHFGFSEHSWKAGLIVSAAVAGAFVGAFIAGFLSSRWGRRASIALADVLFIVGSFVMAFANIVELIFVGRAIVGLGIGISSATIPIYLAEVTAAQTRGATIVVNNVCITGAQLIASIITALLVQFTSINLGWRIALGIAAVPAAIQMIGLLFFLPECPRWLLAKGKSEKAWEVANELGIDLHKLDEEDDKCSKANSNYYGLLSRRMRRRLFIGCMLHVVQQMSGINTIMYYSSVILYDAGFHDSKTPVILSIPLAGINTLFSVFGVFTVDRWGRRLLLQISVFGCLVITLAMTVIGFFLGNQVPYTIGGWVFLSLLGVYLAFFAPGLGAMPWVIMGEIFPNHLRTSASSAATMCNWAFNALVSQVFPLLMGSIGVGGTFSVLCGCIFLSAVFVQLFVVETKGLTLEEIEDMFDSKKSSNTDPGDENDQTNKGVMQRSNRPFDS